MAANGPGARHSRYWRTLKDLAAQGRAVTLRVRVSRWRCRDRGLRAGDFRRSVDRCLGTARATHGALRRRRASGRSCVGWTGGERLLARLGMAVSDDTILRLLKRPVPTPLAPETLQVVGIDDWAWQKGQHHFGTILVDLERRRVVDVLAVRTADAVAAWLAAHPGITIISRDRHGPYAEGVRRGAPQATQVADRFHLVFNLRGAVEQELSRLRDRLIVPSPATATARRHLRRSGVSAHAGQQSAVVEHGHRVQERRARQLARFQLVKRCRPPGTPGQPSCATRGSVAARCTSGCASANFPHAARWIRATACRTSTVISAAALGGRPSERPPAHGRNQDARLCRGLRRSGQTARPMAGGAARSPRARQHSPTRPPSTGSVPIASVAVRHVSPHIAAALLSQPRPLLNERRAQTVDALKAHVRVYDDAALL